MQSTEHKKHVASIQSHKNLATYCKVSYFHIIYSIKKDKFAPPTIASILTGKIIITA